MIEKMFGAFQRLIAILNSSLLAPFRQGAEPDLSSAGILGLSENSNASNHSETIGNSTIWNPFHNMEQGRTHRCTDHYGIDKLTGDKA